MAPIEMKGEVFYYELFLYSNQGYHKEKNSISYALMKEMPQSFHGPYFKAYSPQNQRL